MTVCDGGGEGVQNSLNLCDVIYERPYGTQTDNSVYTIFSTYFHAMCSVIATICMRI